MISSEKKLEIIVHKLAFTVSSCWEEFLFEGGHFRGEVSMPGYCLL